MQIMPWDTPEIAQCKREIESATLTRARASTPDDEAKAYGALVHAHRKLGRLLLARDKAYRPEAYRGRG